MELGLLTLQNGLLKLTSHFLATHRAFPSGHPRKKLAALSNNYGFDVWPEELPLRLASVWSTKPESWFPQNCFRPHRPNYLVALKTPFSVEVILILAIYISYLTFNQILKSSPFVLIGKTQNSYQCMLERLPVYYFLILPRCTVLVDCSKLLLIKQKRKIPSK